MRNAFLASLRILLVSVFTVATDHMKDTRPGIDKPQSENVFQEPQARIIGGNNAREGRYPYMVSLLDDWGESPCGGMLVAADVVLTAAHCRDEVKRAQVGRWNRASESEDYEEFEIVELHVHPNYVEDEFPFDFLLLKLSRQSNKQYILLNEDSDLPSGQRVDEVTALGFGYTKYGDFSSLSNILQEVDLTYIPNDVCELAKDPRTKEGYQGLITADMLCTQENGQDACQGDSGGPLIIARGIATSDILVGVISWGYGCAVPTFPGVYSRISDQIDWLKSKICNISDNPPQEYDCGPKTVPVTIVMQFDDFPREIGWTITEQETGDVLVEVPMKTYEVARSRVQETVFLPAGSTCFFKVEDEFGDGLCCNVPGNYMVVLGRNPTGEVLVTGGGDFGKEQIHEFQVAASVDDTKEPDDGQVIGEGQITLTIVIQLDDYPQEIGWRVDRLDIEAEQIVRVPAGIYVKPQTKIVRTIVLEKEELYYFRVYDVNGDGIDGGYVQLFLGATDTNEGSRKIFQVEGDFKSKAEFSFLAGLNEATEAPAIDSASFMTLELRMDLYPEEIAVQLRASNSETATLRQSDVEDTVLFFRLPRYYIDDVDEVVTERIPIPEPSPGATRQYTFVITDSYGDGMCCNWRGQLETGYTLYHGEPEEGNVIVTSSFEGTSREVTGFNLGGESDDAASDPDLPPQFPAEPQPTVDVKVIVTLDQYPDETGFYIEDDTGKRVIDILPGTYRDQNVVVEEIYTLEIGIYKFTITDYTGDGLVRDDSHYALQVVGDTSRPALVAGSGTFSFQESHFFIVEGITAQYPLTIRFSTDEKPREFGFFINRLDLLEADALVAKVPKGSYQSKYQDVTETLMVKEGGLYRIVFEDSGQDGIGDIRIIVGSANANDLKALSYTVKAGDWQEWQVKIVAGKLPVPPADGLSVDLRIRFDQFPHEVEWIIIGNSNQAIPLDLTRSLREQEVLAYGPPEAYGQNLEGKEYVETIRLPNHVGEKTFIMIVTDYAGDGVCCTFGDGGPVELFDGSIEEGGRLFSDPFQETGRVAESFVLVGTAVPSSAQMPQLFGLLLTILLMTLGLCAQ